MEPFRPTGAVDLPFQPVRDPGGGVLASCWAAGTPRPKGSKARSPWGGVYEQSEHLKGWMRAVTAAAAQAIPPGFQPPSREVGISMDIAFFFDRPRNHFRLGRYSHLLREDAPVLHTRAPDVDKLTRAVLDAVTGVWFVDDSQVCVGSHRKAWADEPGGAGCWAAATVVEVRKH